MSSTAKFTVAGQVARSLKARLLNRLLDADGWTQRDALTDGLSTCRVAIEDALADLVVEDAAEFKPGVGYRLKGTVLCREAMRTLKRERVQRAVKATSFGDMVRIGVAEQRADCGLVMYELELPAVALGDGPKYQKQLNAILKWGRHDGIDHQ